MCTNMLNCFHHSLLMVYSHGTCISKSDICKLVRIKQKMYNCYIITFSFWIFSELTVVFMHTLIRFLCKIIIWLFINQLKISMPSFTIHKSYIWMIVLCFDSFVRFIRFHKKKTLSMRCYFDTVVVIQTCCKRSVSTVLVAVYMLLFDLVFILHLLKQISFTEWIYF